MHQRVPGYRSRLWFRVPGWLAGRLWLENLMLFCLSFCGFTASQSVFNHFVPNFSSGWALYWPFDGVLLALLLMVRRRRWPWIVAGFALTFVVSEHLGHDPWAEIGIDVSGNVAEVLLGAAFLPPFYSLRQWLLEKRLLTRFTIFAVVLGPGITALPVSGYFDHLYPGSFWENGRNWAFADALGTALWMPMVLVLFSRETYELFRWRRLPETAALLGLLCAVCWLAFHQNAYPLSFLPYPFLLLAALRLGFSGAVIGANLLTLIVAGISIRGMGPFQLDPQIVSSPHVTILQVYCTLALLLVFPLGVTLVEGRHFEDQLKQALEETKQQAITDKLTNLANRRQFDHVLDLEWRRAVRGGDPVGLLMIDADYFKAYNDYYGHPGGDECLRQIAAILTDGAHRHHDLIARYGGEEFAILLPGASLAFTQAFGERTRKAVEKAAMPHAKNPYGRITVSVGCASMVPTLGVREEELIAAADRALYVAKKAGRNCVAEEELVAV